MLRIGIYSPYFHILGGGERYLLTIGEFLSQSNAVTLFSDSSIKEKARYIFNIPLNRVQFLPNKIIRTKNLFKRFEILHGFDIFFYMTDGSLFFPFSKKNYLIIQSPSHTPSLTLLNKLKLLNWRIICYSQFMQRIIEKRLNMSPVILSPAIDTESFKCDLTKKKNIILSVGRFFSHLHNKRHDFLIEVFKKYYKTIFRDWQLIIAGGLTDREGEEVVKNLQKESKGYQIKILVNIPFNSLRLLYQEAKIYWHAAGFGEDVDLHSERVEHFGITTLEAMAAGCVPIVFDAGGQRDIVIDENSGHLWRNEKEFLAKNKKILNNFTLWKELSISAQKRSLDFSLNKFYEKLNQVVSE